MRNHHHWIWALLLALAPPLAAGRDAEPSAWDKLAPAWDRISEKLVAFAGEDKQKLLADLAFAAVSSKVCEGLELDRDKYKAAFDGLEDDAYRGLPAEAKAEYGPKLMHYYGVYVGLLTAEGLLEKTAFCGYALGKQAKGEGAYWLGAKAGQ